MNKLGYVYELALDSTKEYSFKEYNQNLEELEKV